MSNVLILGGTGMLGHKLWQRFNQTFDTWATTRSTYLACARYGIFNAERLIEKVDVFDFDTVLRAFTIAKPDVVVNAVGIIKQLEEAKDPIISLSVNSLFPHRLARLCSATGTRLIHLSTDCVFSGRSGMYREDDQPDPVDLYGQSKLLGEINLEGCLTIRTSIIGRELKTQSGLIEWLFSNGGKRVRGFTHAIYTGFPTLCLVDIISDIITNWSELSGVWHISSEPITKHELLCLVRDVYQLPVEIEPFADFYCDRSLDSSRFRKVTGFQPMPWPEMIQAMAADPTPYDEWKK